MGWELKVIIYHLIMKTLKDHCKKKQHPNLTKMFCKDKPWLQLFFNASQTLPTHPQLGLYGIVKKHSFAQMNTALFCLKHKRKSNGSSMQSTSFRLNGA